ncbi:hypothetical protein F6V25_11610 [Oryzomonas japonica]|uniref:Lipoprotein SmpA/OmlA domain-containing protein n=1 Tax=Oryzomonas japonica TaxID=2603858 RepID=A0A7J4ZPD6_9BACT|nr:hypothetical protein [Oryzomonas japonica]KAB0664708.1 hypothetical protein F6V25_11610 [Oryzomonas japonica]
MRHTVFILAVATILFAGCVYRITPQNVEQKLIAGKTTKQEVVKLYGAPYLRYKTPGMSMASGKKEYQLHTGGEIWLYYIHYLGLLDIMEQETLRILFNEKGIVSSYTFTNATSAGSFPQKPPQQSPSPTPLLR